jgi:hypothetical protein
VSYNEEMIIRYESLIGSFNNYFDSPIKITNQSIFLSFLNNRQSIAFLKDFLKKPHLVKLENNSLNVEIKILNLFDQEKLLKDILHSLENTLSKTLITVNRNCYYGE